MWMWTCTDTMLRPSTLQDETLSFTHISYILSQSPWWRCHILSETTAIVLARKCTSHRQPAIPTGVSQCTLTLVLVQQEESSYESTAALRYSLFTAAQAREEETRRRCVSDQMIHYVDGPTHSQPSSSQKCSWVIFLDEFCASKVYFMIKKYKYL